MIGKEINLNLDKLKSLKDILKECLMVEGILNLTQIAVEKENYQPLQIAFDLAEEYSNIFSNNGSLKNVYELKREWLLYMKPYENLIDKELLSLIKEGVKEYEKTI